MKTRTNEFLNETNKIKNLIKKIIREQFESPKSNILDCIKTYVKFALTPTDFEDEEIYGPGQIAGGGDLGLWNKNKIPSPSDKRAFQRFVDYMKEVSRKGDAINDEDECEGIFFEDMEPMLKPVYLEVLLTLSPPQVRRGKLDTLLHIAKTVPQDDYDDPFDWLEQVFTNAELEGVDVETNREGYIKKVLKLWKKGGVARGCSSGMC
jgi:hypothetical protein